MHIQIDAVYYLTQVAMSRQLMKPKNMYGEQIIKVLQKLDRI